MPKLLLDPPVPSHPISCSFSNHGVWFALDNCSWAQACPAMWWIPPVSLYWRKLIVPSHQLLSVNNFSAGYGTLCNLRFFVVGFSLTWSYTGQSLWVHMYICPIMPGRYCFLRIIHISGSYNLSIPSSSQIPKPWGEGCDKTIPFRVSTLKSLSLPSRCPAEVSAIVPIYCKNCPLMRSEWCGDLWE